MASLSRSAAPAPDVRLFRRYQHLIREGETPEGIYRVEDGWACRYRSLSSGRRQITALFLPGEYCEPQWLLEARTESPVIALTPLRASSLALSDFSSTAPSAKENMRTMLSATLRTLNRQSEWIATLGRKTAMERVCALLSDVFERLQVSGRAANDRCVMPLTQADLADVVGLTPVHVNRVLRKLRASGLIELRSRWLRLSDPVTLSAIGTGRTPPRLNAVTTG